jgi:hypothetical protein
MDLYEQKPFTASKLLSELNNSTYTFDYCILYNIFRSPDSIKRSPNKVLT